MAEPTMRAAVHTRYGPPGVIELRQVARPQPAAGEILVRVHASSVGRTDCGLLRAQPPIVRLFEGLGRPRRTVLGLDFAGEVAAVGQGVRRFEPGQRVFGLAAEAYGAHAEYLCLPQDGAVAELPATIPFDEAVVCEGAWYANMYLETFGVDVGHRLLIYGASGAIGSSAVQLAKARGADVTAVVATRHLDLVEYLGADQAVDYTAEDFTAIGETYDFVLDAVGKSSYFQCRGLLAPGGGFAGTDLGPWLSNPILAAACRLTGSRRVVFPIPKQARALVNLMRTLLAQGRFHPVIDRKYPLEAIADAFHYVETETKTGVVSIQIIPPG